jgi:FixJ family two-component response regulator
MRSRDPHSVPDAAQHARAAAPHPAASSGEPVVYLIDDDASVREALSSLIRAAGLNVEAYASAEAFLAREGTQAGPGCLVLDLRLPELSGLELQRELARSRDAMPIIFITGHGDIPTTVQAMKAGATEFLTKPFSDEALLQAVRYALERAGRLQAASRDLAVLRERYATLTTREREVLSRIVFGLLNKQVASELGLSEITVKVHRRRVMEKMQAGSLAELVRMTDRLGGASIVG